MAKRQKPVHQTALPLKQWMDARNKSGVQVAKLLNISMSQTITNWLARGVPAYRIPEVAALCGLTTDEYRIQAGLAPGSVKGKQPTLLGATHMADFKALPDYLQMYIERQTSDLRKLYETLPAWLRDKLVPPKDAEQYQTWERDIQALMR